MHRIVEQRASATPEAIAITDGSRITTYRELNQWANGLARCLAASGVTRGSLSLVRRRRGSELAAVLLAILKAGASYAWCETGSAEESDHPDFCIRRRGSLNEDEYLALNIERIVHDCTLRIGPNLPILTRGDDVACVLPDANGRPTVLVPHATIASLPRPRSLRQAWEGSVGALDLWVALMSGATLSVGAASPATAAA